LSKITTAIPEQAFELIRDKIGLIIADELAAQFVLNPDPRIDAPVFIERIVPIDKSETPVINILYSRSNYDNNTAIKSDGENTYNIDVYSKGKSKEGEQGDTLAMIALARLLGVIRAILESPHYLTLGFAPPFIKKTTVTGIQVADPRDNQDGANMMMGRLTFTVDAVDVTEQIQPVDAEGYDTQVKLSETDKGFVYISNN